MGNECMPSKQKIKESKLVHTKISVPVKQPSYGMIQDPQKKKIIFHHAPLTNSQFLSHKFYQDPHSPSEINLLFQIVDAKVNKNQLVVNTINYNAAELYVVFGGKSIKSQTGLYQRIQKYTQLYRKNLNLPSVQKEKGDFHGFRMPISATNLKIILESKSKQAHSMFLVNSYLILGDNLQLEHQQFQWNSLAFELGYIYGQHQQKITGKNIDENVCVVCQVEEVTCIFDPCRHMCLCKKCMKEYRKTYQICPLCKISYAKIIAYNDLEN